MADTFSIARSLGLFDEPSEEIGGLARAMKTLRDLGGPSPKEKFEWQKQLDGYKVAMGHIENIITNRHIDDASKEWAYQLLDMMVSHADPVLRPAIAALRGAKYLSEEQRRAREFDRVFPERPRPPTGPNGEPLPLTEDNEFAHALYRFRTMEYDYTRTGAIFGKDVASLLPMPKAIQIMPWVGEGDKKRRGNVWYLEPRTKIPMALPWESIGMPTEKKLEQWGWSLSRVLMEGQYPIGESKDMIFAGKQMRVWPMRNLLTGKDQMDQTLLGKVDPKEPDAKLKEVWAAAVLDLDTEKMEPWQADMVDKLRTEVEFDTVDEYLSYADELNQALGPMAGDWKILPNVIKDSKTGKVRVRNLEESQKWKIWNRLDKRFYIKDRPWVMVPWTGDIVTVQDQFGQEGQVYKVPTKDNSTHLVDPTGSTLPNSKGAGDGATIPGVSFGTPFQPAKERFQENVEEARGAIMKLWNWLQEMDRERIEKAKKNQTLPEPAKSWSWTDVPGGIKRILSESMGPDKAKELVEAWSKEYTEQQGAFIERMTE